MQPTKAQNSLEPLGLRELTEVLVRHYGLTQGKYGLNVEFHIGAGTFGPSEEKRGPGFAIGMGRVGLIEAPADGPYTIDASELQKSPPKKGSKERRSANR